MKKKTYHTKQRALILEFLKANPDKHLTVQEIFNYFNRTGKPVGMTTVYRHLNALEEQGDVHKYILDNVQGAFYEYVEDETSAENRFHFKCEECGSLLHVSCKEMSHLQEHMQRDHGFSLDASRLLFYGVCESCQKKKLAKVQTN